MMRDRAFPNAYIDTDVPPRRSLIRRVFCLAAVAGVAYLGGVILLLTLFWSAYSPITQVASDYGVGAYAAEMNSGFFFAGAGVMALALVVVFSDAARGVRVGGALLLPAGDALVVNAIFQTDVEGAAVTFHGTVHALGGLLFFLAAPLGLILIARGFGRTRFALTLLAFAATVALFVAEGASGYNAGGMGERVLILVTFTSLIYTSASFAREA